MAKTFILSSSGARVDISTEGERVIMDGFNFKRTDLLAALGAVDAPVEVPSKPFAVISNQSGVQVVKFPTGWTDGDGSKWTESEVRYMLETGGTILSEGVEQ